MDVSADRSPDPLAAWMAATGAAASPPPPDDPTSGPATPPRRLLIAAAAPWLVVIVLGATIINRPAPPASDVTAPRSEITPSAAPAAAADDPPAPADAVTAAGSDRGLAAAAVLTVRLTTPDDQYVDTAVAERIDALAGATVVTVAAVVLDRVGGAWSGPRHVRFAIPFSPDQVVPVALSQPWVLPSIRRSRGQPPGTPVNDDALTEAATTALRAAGYRDLAPPQLHRHPALPDILAAHVRARAPGEPAARDHEIWLDAAGTRVLGVPPAEDRAQLPAPVPAEAP